MKIYVPVILTHKKEEFFGAFDKKGLVKFLRGFKKKHSGYSLNYTSDNPEDDKAPKKYWFRCLAFDSDEAELRVISFPLNKNSHGLQLRHPLFRLRKGLV